MSCSRLFSLCFLITISWASRSAASTVVQMDLAALATRAERIIVGVCEDRTIEEVDGRLHTRTTFAVRHVVKGPVQDRIVVLFPGGENDGVRQWVVGMPGFEPGEEVVVFLSSPDHRGRVWPIGLAQGKFAIWRDEKGNARVTPSDGDIAQIAAPGEATAKPVPLARTDGMALQDFLAEVGSLVGGGGDADAR